MLPRAETEITAKEAWADDNHKIYVAVDAFRGCQCDSTVCEGFESGKDVSYRYVFSRGLESKRFIVQVKTK